VTRLPTLPTYRARPPRRLSLRPPPGAIPPLAPTLDGRGAADREAGAFIGAAPTPVSRHPHARRVATALWEVPTAPWPRRTGGRRARRVAPLATKGGRPLARDNAAAPLTATPRPLPRIQSRRRYGDCHARMASPLEPLRRRYYRLHTRNAAILSARYPVRLPWRATRRPRRRRPTRSCGGNAIAHGTAGGNHWRVQTSWISRPIGGISARQAERSRIVSSHEGQVSDGYAPDAALSSSCASSATTSPTCVPVATTVPGGSSATHALRHTIGPTRQGRIGDRSLRIRPSRPTKRTSSAVKTANVWMELHGLITRPKPTGRLRRPITPFPRAHNDVAISTRSAMVVPRDTLTRFMLPGTDMILTGDVECGVFDAISGRVRAARRRWAPSPAIGGGAHSPTMPGPGIVDTPRYCSTSAGCDQGDSDRGRGRRGRAALSSRTMDRAGGEE